MYKVASDKRQRGLHHGKPADWVNGNEALSPKDKLRQLQEGTRIIDRRLAETLDPKERQELILAKKDAESEIVAFKDKHGFNRRGPQDDFPQLFIECAKEMLTSIQFKTIKAAAQRELDRRKENATPEPNGHHSPQGERT